MNHTAKLGTIRGARIKLVHGIALILFGLFPKAAAGKSDSKPTTSSPMVSEPDSTAVLKKRLGINGSGAQLTQKEFSPPITLDPLVNFALHSHPNLLIEKAKFERAQIGLSISKSRFGPTATIGAQKSLKQQPSELGTTKTYGNSTSAGLTINQNIWNGGQDLLDYQQQEVALEEAQLQLASAEKMLAWRIRLSGLQYFQAAMDLSIAELSLKNSKEIVNLSEQKAKAGQVGKIDLMQSQQQFTQSLTEVSSAEIKLAQAQENLETLLLLPANDPRHGTFLTLLSQLKTASFTRPEPSWLEKLNLSGVLEKQVQWQSQKKLIAQKELEASKARRNRWLPSIDLSLSYQKSFEPKNTDAISGQDEDPINAGVNLSWPLWDQPRGLQINKVQAELGELRSKENETHRSLTIELEKNKAHLQRLFKLFEFRKTAYDQSESLYQAKIQLYRAGAIDIITLTNAANERLRSLQSIYATISELQTEWLKLLALCDGINIQLGKSSSAMIF